MSPMSAEATVVRNYIDWILALPWYERTKDKLDLEEAERILNEDHYGLEKPKQRILEHLAVQKLVKWVRNQVLGKIINSRLVVKLRMDTEHPAKVRPPEPLAGAVGIFFGVGPGVVHAVLPDPFAGAVLAGQSSK